MMWFDIGVTCGAVAAALVALGLLLCGGMGFVALLRGSGARGRFGIGRLALAWEVDGEERLPPVTEEIGEGRTRPPPPRRTARRPSR